MGPGVHVPRVEAAGLFPDAGRQRWQQARQGAIQALYAGHSGPEVCLRLTQAADDLVGALMTHLTQDRPWLGESMALLAVGGYGRRELCLYSDLDLLLLHEARHRAAADQLAARLVPALWDMGFAPGVAVRTVSETVRLAWKDHTVFTTVLVARPLWGSRKLCQALHARLGASGSRSGRRRALAQTIWHHRQLEHRKFGETPYLLEPDVKRSWGGLRDYQVLLWVGKLFWGADTPSDLVRLGKLDPEDGRLAVEAHRYLLTVRAWLHARSSRCSDRLSWSEQLSLAEQFGFRDTAAQRGVEQFMRRVYTCLNALGDVTERTLQEWLPPGRMSPEMVRACHGPWKGLLRIHQGLVDAVPGAERQFREDLVLQLQLANFLAETKAPYTNRLYFLVQRSPTIPDVDRLPARRAFLQLLGQARHLGDALRWMNRTGLLSRIIPEFEHARGHVQFNAYHVYTVDEHSIRAVEAAEQLNQADDLAGKIYRDLHRKDLLHLALLIHDLGKGYPADHSLTGRQLAQSISRRFELTRQEEETLVFLVGEHLLLSHVALRRDLDDPVEMAQVARRIGTPERLNMLYVLSLCDMSAVGPGRLTSWKCELLKRAYLRLLELLSGTQILADPDEVTKEARRKLVCLGRALGHTFVSWVDSLPPSYLLGTPVEQLLHDYRTLRTLRRSDVRVVVGTKEGGLCEVTVYTFDRPRLFCDIVAGLTAAGSDIVSARIATLPDGTIVDRFLVRPLAQGGDTEYHDKLLRRVEEAILSRAGPAALLELPRPYRPERQPPMQALPEIRIDTESSSQYTIIDVFCEDHPGLLYKVSRTLYELGLNIWLAKIATAQDQVVDVFYVTDQAGYPIRSPEELFRIKHHLLAALTERSTNPSVRRS